MWTGLDDGAIGASAPSSTSEEEEIHEEREGVARSREDGAAAGADQGLVLDRFVSGLHVGGFAFEYEQD